MILNYLPLILATAALLVVFAFAAEAGIGQRSHRKSRPGDHRAVRSRNCRL
jgi:hypothetical protein